MRIASSLIRSASFSEAAARSVRPRRRAAPQRRLDETGPPPREGRSPGARPAAPSGWPTVRRADVETHGDPVRPLILAALLVAAVMLPAERAEAFTVESCSGPQSTDVLSAASFIDANLADMVADMTFLNNRRQGEVLRKWPRLAIHCVERRGCRDSGVGGFAHGGLGNRVNVCYDTMVDRGSSRWSRSIGGPRAPQLGQTTACSSL